METTAVNEAFTELLVTFVLGLYPREWRARYGGEIRDLILVLNIEHRRSLLRIIPSLIAGATVERFHALRRLDRAGMTAALLVTMVAVAGTLTFAQRVDAKRNGPMPISASAHGSRPGHAGARDARDR